MHLMQSLSAARRLQRIRQCRTLPPTCLWIQKTFPEKRELCPVRSEDWNQIPVPMDPVIQEEKTQENL